jgi:hypothetical protein
MIILTTVNREILVMVLFWPILAPKYKVPKLNTPKYVTLQKLAAKIEHGDTNYGFIDFSFFYR